VQDLRGGMRVTKVYSIELLYALEPQITKAQAEVLCSRLLEGVREYLSEVGFAVNAGSVQSRMLTLLSPEPGDDTSLLGSIVSNTIH